MKWYKATEIFFIGQWKGFHKAVISAVVLPFACVRLSVLIFFKLPVDLLARNW